MAGGDKNNSKRNRNRINVDVDRISDLPVHLRELILDLLSMKEAIATSVLSSKWRYCWTGLSKLDFDADFWCWRDPNLVKRLELIIAVDRVLMLLRGPIRKFKLFVPGMDDKEVDINVWLRILSNSGVHNIKIDASAYFDSTFPIPSCLFECRELEKLSLRMCKLANRSDFKCFANLTSLTLDSVDIDNSLLESFISGCPKLEKLSIKGLIYTDPLHLEALNLKKFYFYDSAIYLEDIIFKDIPKLTCVSLLCDLRINDTLEMAVILDVLCSLSKIEELTFDFHLLVLVYENYPSSTHVPLENLKSLTLTSVDLRLSGDVLFTLCFLRSAPNLQNLTIDLCNVPYCCQFDIGEEQREADKLLESEAKKQTSYNNLQTIKIRGVKGIRHENLLIKLLQTRCPKVKSIITKT